MSQPSSPDAVFNRRVVELLIRLALVVVLFGWCFLIVSPFLTIMVWALILAVAVYPAHRRLAVRLGGRSETSAALFVLLGLLALALPVWLFAGSLIDGGSHISRVLKEG